MVALRNVWKAVLITALSAIAFIALYLIVNNFDFSSGTRYRVIFDYVGTITRGSLVRKSGLKIGTVKNLRIDPADQKSVIVQITVARGQSVRTGDRFAIVTRGILGDQYVEVFPGPADAPAAEEGFTFNALPMFDFNTLVIQGGELMRNLLESTATLNRLLTSNESSVSHTLRNIEDLTASLSTVTGSSSEIARFVPDMKQALTDSMKALSESVISLSAESKKLIASLDAQVGSTSRSLGRSLDSVSTAAEELSRLLTRLNASDSVFTRLNQQDTSDDLVSILNNLEVTTRNIMSASADIRKSVEDLLGSGESQ